ncbi:hypothetical protein HYT18_00885 [Candidatus Microgenomates bacterium]|nr:hypothetical protein [Candidatus Microgenomates bacterium]
MSKERYQQELAKRESNNLPFEDESLVSGVVRAIMDGMERIRKGSGSIVYPESLSSREVGRVKRILEKHNVGLLRRIEAFASIRLEENMGTEILIREKMRRR